MVKTILWLCWLELLVWFFSPVLEIVFPIPSEAMVQGFLNLSTERDQIIFTIMRYAVWTLLLEILIRIGKPFLSFAFPAAKKYAVTKPMRRLQGIVTEFGLFGVFFVFISIFLVMPFGLISKYGDELSLQERRIRKSAEALPEKRDKLYKKLKFVAMQGNKLLINQKNNLNAWLFNKRYKYYLRTDDYFKIPYLSHRTYTDDGKVIMRSKYIAPITPNNYLELPRNEAGGYILVNKIESYKKETNFFTIYKNYKNYRQQYDALLKEYNQIVDDMKTFHHYVTVRPEGRSYFMDLTVDYSIVEKKAEENVWSEYTGKPIIFMFMIMYNLWTISFVLTFLIYGFSHTKYRYKFAPYYERVLRFFEQGRFGMGGSARFAGIIEEWASLYKRQKEGIFLGRSLFNPFLNIGIQDKRHMLTVAATRAGKGTTAIIPNLLLWEGSTIVIDPKGTNAAVTARKRKEMGQNVHIVDPFNIVNDEDTAKFNPLAHIDPESETIREDISMIAEALVVPDPNQKERHWDDGARTVIAGLIAHLVTSGDYENPNLSMVRDMLGLEPEKLEDLWIDMIMNTKAGGLAKDAGSRIMRGAQTNEISSIISNADKHTEWLSAPTMKNALSETTFQFSDMKEKPTTIYLVLPPNKLVTYNRFLRLFINLALSEVSSGGRSKVPVLMIMDEFLALGRMEEVEKALGLLAGYNLVMWPIVQEIGKLKDIYKDSFNSFINNSRAIQVFGVQGDTAEFVSKFLGERRTNRLSKKDNWEMAAKLRAPNEVAIDVSVDYYWQYVLRAGKAPLVLERVPYYKHKMFQGMYDKDPDYA